MEPLATMIKGAWIREYLIVRHIDGKLRTYFCIQEGTREFPDDLQ